MRYLAIDYGTKRTGLAVCDEEETIATPLTVLHSRDNLVKQIVDTIEEECIEAVIIGLPFLMDGTEGIQAKRTRAFGVELEKAIDIPVLFHDERLSSFDAEEKLAGLELTNKRRKKRLDAVAAANILQCFLEHNHGQSEANPEAEES